MNYTNLHFLGSNPPGGLMASHLSKIFPSSTANPEEISFNEDDVVIYIDFVGVMQEREIWEKFGNPKCILHLCNSGYNSQTGGYKRVSIDIHVEAIEEVNNFLKESDFFEEGKPKLV